jgi:hypothetical protein
VTLLSAAEISPSTGCTIRHLLVTIGSKSKEITHYYFPSWPDFGAIKSADRLMLVELMRQSRAEAGVSPRIVHCSAGVGRTGSFIAVDFILNEMMGGRLLENHHKRIPSSQSIFTTPPSNIIHEVSTPTQANHPSTPPPATEINTMSPSFQRISKSPIPNIDEHRAPSTATWRNNFDSVRTPTVSSIPNAEAVRTPVTATWGKSGPPRTLQDPAQESQKDENDVINLTVDALREQRMMMVMNDVQYHYLYDVVRETWTDFYREAAIGGVVVTGDADLDSNQFGAVTRGEDDERDWKTGLND